MTWIKNKMSISLNAENLSKLNGFLSGLPEETRPKNISNLLVYLLENSGKPENQPETKGLLEEIRELTEQRERFLSEISGLQKENQELKTSKPKENQEVSEKGKPVNQSGKPKENQSGKPVNQKVSEKGNPVVTTEVSDSKPVKIWFEL